MSILLFGGTAEGHSLARRLAQAGLAVTCSVATAYGEAVLEPTPGLTVHVGRMDADQMAAEMAKGYTCVVDATHPYADRVSENIRRAAETAGLPYYRLLRPREAAEGVLWADSPADAARMLADLPGNVLLTTGSKDLKTFTQVPDYRDRLYVRVLPSLESLSAALDLGYPAAHILCMQGPFPEKLNAALLEAVDAKILVTKDTGKAGGFPEKAAAARSAGAKLLVIRRPTQETGYTLDALYDFLTKGRERL
ncbi:MAG TPA: precorrin-6A reductase [Candidatus Avoscillospira stercorigallinarum]|uniref:Precorrin-6A reductase n=1 Tax=Candidatus Avoscillospira stercorigallinarum TaxID=2840708 RepID=A0A9D0Z5S0_9FIRM|nr:precorrin-6A reductase [Candidatus Avoscillospira stercorigallinarum]